MNRQVTAALFRRAAAIMAGKRHTLGTCGAISKALDDGAGYCTPAHDKFEEMFDWFVSDKAEYNEHWGSYGKSFFLADPSSRECRVLALLFVADMIDAGDL